MTTPTIRIAHGNGHNKDELVRWLDNVDADSASAQEAQRLIGNFRKAMPDHRLTVAGPGWDEPKGRAKSTLIMTRNKFPNIGQGTRQVSERIEKYERIAPDRVLVWSMFEHPLASHLGREGIAHFSLHPDAGPALRDGNNIRHPIVREYLESLQSTARWLTAARRDGLLLILTGDLQLPKGGRWNTLPWHPHNVIGGPLGMKERAEGIDWIMVDRLLEFRGPMATHKLYDHTGFSQTVGVDHK